MAWITLDVQLLVQTFLYAANIVLGLAVAVPLGITIGDFNGQCILYAHIDWNSLTFMTSNVVNCRFGIYVSVCFCVLYALGMIFYHVYLLTRNDPSIGSKMWVFPFIVVNSVVAFVTFISSCIISVGFKTFCDGFLKGREMGHIISSCADGEKFTWNADYRTHSFYTYLTVTQIATWSTLLVWVLLVIEGIIRFLRNRRQANAQATSDLKNFAASEPSA
ncbi:transmembrane protein 179-like [Haliotis rubra]|uniref:transmembrane protein 179-like n=1 Tax=Haliotis rubra TaxID=36100 RepID=UPI001EE5DCAA|nr:transmembrane protein 179-like [Haliotis rubra]